MVVTFMHWMDPATYQGHLAICSLDVSLGNGGCKWKLFSMHIVTAVNAGILTLVNCRTQNHWLGYKVYTIVVPIVNCGHIFVATV